MVATSRRDGRQNPLAIVCAVIGIFAGGQAFATLANADNAAGKSLNYACGVPARLALSRAPVRVFAAAVARRQSVTIVALGSSSTQGVGATSASRSYPAQLEAELKRMYQSTSVVVVNAGIGGQTAAQMLSRLEHDVLRLKPQLVIWQTGVNDVISGVSVRQFEATLRLGINHMKQRGIDVVLVDQQDFPGSSRFADFDMYLQVMSTVGAEEGAPLLRRHRIMQHLADTEPGGLNRLLANDQFHMNDIAHSCVGLILADGLKDLAANSAP